MTIEPSPLPMMYRTWDATSNATAGSKMGARARSQSSGGIDMQETLFWRPTFYMEILLGPWIRPGIVDDGVMAFPLPAFDRRVLGALRSAVRYG